MSSKLKRVRVDEDSDNDDQPIKRSRKKQIIESDEDSPVKKKKSKAKDDSDFEAMETETQSDDDMQSEPATESEPESEVEESPKKKPKKKPAAKAKTVINKSLNLASFMADNDDEEIMGSQWEHEKQEWLKPENIRDANKNRPDSAEYDPTTLYVPPEYIKKLTPGMGNWWKIKSRNYDTVIYYKVGKFYELYHMDAVSGVNVCGLTYMKDRVACSFIFSLFWKVSLTSQDILF